MARRIVGSDASGAGRRVGISDLSPDAAIPGPDIADPLDVRLGSTIVDEAALDEERFARRIIDACVVTTRRRRFRRGLLCGNLFQGRDIERGNSFCQCIRIAGVQVGQDNDRQPIVHEARNLCRETGNAAAMLDESVTMYIKESNAHDIEALTARFKTDAVVADEDLTHRGVEEIRRWIEKTHAEYSFSLEALGFTD